MKPIILIAAWISLLSVHAQTARQDIIQNPCLAAGKYMAYEKPSASQTPAPDGYVPFYISTYARHGSRYLTDADKYEHPLQILEKAKRLNYLTSDGKKAQNTIEQLYASAQNRYGELTPKGAQQHRDLARRMFENYPQVFQPGTHVDARSTYKTRAFLSMTAACIELKGLCPQLNITTDASLADSYYIKYKNKPYTKKYTAGADSVYAVADSLFIHPDRLMHQLFNNEQFIRDSIDNPSELMQEIFELHGISQSSYNQPDLSFLFTPDELYDLWQRNNFEWYYEKGPSPLSQHKMPDLARNLLQNIIETADTAIASSQACVTLRFGHDTNLAPLVSLMEINQFDKATSQWNEIPGYYRTYDLIPMCGNLQLIFYCKGKGRKQILVKALLNEREVTLPVKSKTAPYYEWKTLKDYYLKKINRIILPEVPKGQEDD